jgi:mannose-6-phosphate isomerase-like protein (cupin superfamily)
MKKTIAFSLLALCFAATTFAQQRAQKPARPSTAREDALDPSPVNAAVDPVVDMFINDWRNSAPRPLYGQMIFRDMLTKLEGPDPQHPTRKGAVLTELIAISYASIEVGQTASGRAQAGEFQTFYTVGGNGKLTSNGKTFDIRDGSGFILRPDFDFTLTSTGPDPLEFYVRTDPVQPGAKPDPNIYIMNRFDVNAERHLGGGHWSMSNTGGPPGLGLITMNPRVFPQPHSHSTEECWLSVKGETVLSLGKTIRRMTPGQAYKIPPTGLAAHSNINTGDEPAQLIYLGPAARQTMNGQIPPATPTPTLDFARLDSNPFERDRPDINMFMGNWRDSFPRIMHGELTMWDLLTSLQGPDSLHPTRKGAVLTNATAVSYAILEPKTTAHRMDGELKGIQQTFIVNSGTGVITAGAKKFDLVKDMAFVITPAMDFKMTATGDKYLTFYIVTEKIPAGFTPKSTLDVVDNRGKALVPASWHNMERPLIDKEGGLSQYKSINSVEMKAMTMSRPYSAQSGTEEIWIATDNDIDMIMGQELRRLPAGTAYVVPATGITAHANLNSTDKPARFLYMVK